MTTNISDLDELREQLGARTVSRLPRSAAMPLPLMGEDLRTDLRLSARLHSITPCQDS